MATYFDAGQHDWYSSKIKRVLQPVYRTRIIHFPRFVLVQPGITGVQLYLKLYIFKLDLLENKASYEKVSFHVSFLFFHKKSRRIRWKYVLFARILFTRNKLTTPHKASDNRDFVRTCVRIETNTCELTVSNFPPLEARLEKLRNSHSTIDFRKEVAYRCGDSHKKV